MTRLENMEVITTEESGRWDEILDEIGSFQFYHMSAFHRLAEMYDEGKAVMPVFRDGGCVIAFPLLVRSIPVPGITDVLDAASVRGFAGPVASQEPMPEDVRVRFQQATDDFLKQRGIISVYARLNPLTTPPGILDGYGDTVEVGVTVSLDLTPSSEVQRARYRQGHRYEVNRLRKLGFICEEAGPERIDDFLRVYYDAMDRVGAGPEYYFDRRYIEYLLTEMPEVMHLFVCRQDDVIASAFIETAGCGILEVYLGGTSAEYRRLAPDKLVYDTVREWGTNMGASAYHLGGGVGAQRDSLYEFKMGFGGREHIYSTWRCIVDQDAYHDLLREAVHAAGREPEGSYFPAYRNPSLNSDAL